MIDLSFGWILILAGLAGGIPSTRALLVGQGTQRRWFRLIVHALLVLLGGLEVQRHGNWRPLRQSPAEQQVSAPTAIALLRNPPPA